MLPEQMLLRQLASVKDGPRMLSEKFGQNRISNVTAEIFLIGTNVARTNVAWTNANVRIYSRCSQEPTFKVSSKSGQ